MFQIPEDTLDKDSEKCCNRDTYTYTEVLIGTSDPEISFSQGVQR